MNANQLSTDLYHTVSATLRDFVQGQPEPFQNLWSHADDVTILGAFGGHEVGWPIVGPRLAWAASQFQDGTFLGYTPLSFASSADMADMVAIERAQAVIGGNGPPVIQELRITQIFRIEDGTWKMSTATPTPSPSRHHQLGRQEVVRVVG
jgi:hypothetical protein